jgi:hypothetical protein
MSSFACLLYKIKYLLLLFISDVFEQIRAFLIGHSKMQITARVLNKKYSKSEILQLVTKSLETKIASLPLQQTSFFNGKDWYLFHSISTRRKGKNKRDRISYAYIIEELRMQVIQSQINRNRLKWFGHVKRRFECRIPKILLEMKMTGKRPKVRP